MSEEEIRTIVRAAVDELAEDRKRREELEHRVNDLVAENAQAKAAAAEAERAAAIRAELQRLGVAKLDLAYRAVRDDLRQEGVDLKEYLARFVADNPELLPARVAGGSGASGAPRQGSGGAAVDLDKIRPGMSPEELERVRQEIARVTMLTMRGL
jgi:hypothetical protein